MASRILGFARDILLAALLGSGPVAQAFFVAFRLPNMFRRFFAEGAFNMAFIPLFAKRLEGEGQESARRFAEESVSVLATALIGLTLVAQLAMPLFVYALASGYDDDPSKFDLSVVFARITFPYILFISIAALFSGLLNSFGKFAAAAAAPVLLNVILIGALLLGWQAGWNLGLTLSWAVFFAGIAQLVLVGHAAARLGMVLRPRRPRLTPPVRRLITLGIPAALAGGVMQINLVVGTQVASYFEGAVVWLWMADRVYQLPLGLVGVAIGVVLLPELSRRLRAHDAAGARHSMNRATEFTLLLTLPATVALLVAPVTIVSVLFGRGSYSAEDVQATGLAVAVYAAGLPAFVLLKIVQPAFFAREDTVTPLRYAVVSMVVNVSVAVIGGLTIGWVGAAIGTTLAGWVNLVMLWRKADTFEEVGLDDRLKERIPRIFMASALMGVFVAVAVWTCGPYFALPGWRYLAIALLVCGGGLVFAVAAFKLGAVRGAELRSAMSRQRPPA